MKCTAWRYCVLLLRHFVARNDGSEESFSQTAARNDGTPDVAVYWIATGRALAMTCLRSIFTNRILLQITRRTICFMFKYD